MRLIYAQEDLDNFGYEKNKIFLAGPTPRDKHTVSWRREFLTHLEQTGFSGVVFIPEMRNPDDWTKDFAYDKQIDWEMKAMSISNNIIFWIPRELEKMPGFTTNVEFGYWLSKDPNKIIMGIPETAPKCDYIRYQCNKNKIPLFADMKSVIEYLYIIKK